MDGFKTATGNALYVRNLPNLNIDGLDLGYTGLSRSGIGIYSDSNLGAGTTIQNVMATNRSFGIQKQHIPVRRYLHRRPGRRHGTDDRRG